MTRSAFLRLFSLPLATAILPGLTHGSEALAGAKRVLFLGDSITHSGHYVDDFSLFLAVTMPSREIEIINCGLPSETVSGLSEPGHAGGKFPRPDLHERLGRVLALAKPDVVFACYGMNCGIYLPLEETRFAAYRAGIEKLRTAVLAANAQMIHATPPVFDALPIAAKVKPAATVKPGEMVDDYDSVLAHYAAWLVREGKNHAWQVIDVHTAMATALKKARQQNPSFTFANDGVHPNEAGHIVIAQALIRGVGGTFDTDSTAYTALRKLIRQRNTILRDAMLAATGHKRPGMPHGLPLTEAQSQAASLTDEIRKLANAR